MFVALGVGAYPAGIFHLFTHAFFKALLFLGAGSVIHAVPTSRTCARWAACGTQIPLTYWMMVIGTLALTGFPLTAGFFSKDAIIEAAFAGDQSASPATPSSLTVVAALLTAFYSWRLIFLTFHGKPRASDEVMDHVARIAAGDADAARRARRRRAARRPRSSRARSSARSYAEFWQGALFTGADNHVLADDAAHAVLGDRSCRR